MKGLINWLLASSVFTAACSLSLCLATEKLLLGAVPPLVSPLHCLIIGSSLLEYNVHRLFNPHAISGINRRWYYALSATGLLLCLGSLPFLSVHFIAWLAFLGAITISYSLPVFKRRLKDFGLLKIAVLTTVWVIATTVLPVVYWHKPLTFFWWKIVLRTELIFALCIAFDIRDMPFDASRNVLTLAGRLGIPKAYHIIDAVLLVFFITGICQLYFERSVLHLIAIAITYIAAKSAITYSRRNAHNHVYLGLIDGVMLLYGVLVILL